MDMGKCCHLVDMSCNYTWTTRAYGHRAHIRPRGLFMITAALGYVLGTAIAEIHVDQNVISRKPSATEIMLTPLKKKGKQNLNFNNKPR